MYVKLTDIQMSIRGNKINKSGVLSKLPVIQFTRQDILEGTASIPAPVVKKTQINTMGASFETTAGIIDIMTQDFIFVVKDTSNLITLLQSATGSTGETEIRLLFKYQSGNTQNSLVAIGTGIFTATGADPLQQTDIIKLKFNISYSSLKYNVNGVPIIRFSVEEGLYAY